MSVRKAAWPLSHQPLCPPTAACCSCKAQNYFWGDAQSLHDDPWKLGTMTTFQWSVNHFCKKVTPTSQLTLMMVSITSDHGACLLAQMSLRIPKKEVQCLHVWQAGNPKVNTFIRHLSKSLENNSKYQGH